MPQQMIIDYEKAYKFGTLVDAILTEPHKVNYFTFSVGEVKYTEAEFAKAADMKRAFMADPLCASMLKQASTQSIMARRMDINYAGFNFFLDVRCKWDIWMAHANWGGDIKSTAATTQKGFEEAVRYFDYDRQRAWYMDIAGSDRDILIGISKVNNKIFKVPIQRNDELFKSGEEKYKELSFKYWYLFSDELLKAA